MIFAVSSLNFNHALFPVSSENGKQVIWEQELAVPAYGKNEELASFSLVVFILTGIYLSLKILRNKGWGLFFLAAGLLSTAWIFLTFMYF